MIENTQDWHETRRDLLAADPDGCVAEIEALRKRAEAAEALVARWREAAAGPVAKVDGHDEDRVWVWGHGFDSCNFGSDIAATINDAFAARFGALLAEGE
jgi:hypothetical protein